MWQQIQLLSQGWAHRHQPLLPPCHVPGSSTVVANCLFPAVLRPYAPQMIDQRLQELGIVLPPVFPPAGNYLGCVVDNGVVYAGGHGPINGDNIMRGKVGRDLSLAEGQQAARMTALSILATLQAELGDLDQIARIVKVFGMVNVAPGFNQTPAVIDGASDLLVDIFGDAGRHTRSAVGLAELPFDIAVEIELIARLRSA